MNINFKTLRYKNVLSTGNVFTEIKLDQHRTTLISGQNGSGKCVRGSTEVDIDFADEDIKEKFEEFLKSR
jgi:predicted ATP-binding protein involved in virulence